MSFSKKTIRDIDLAGQRVLLRAMLNVPIKDGQVSDKMRLRAAKPTIDYLIEQKAKIVLASHHSTEGQSLEPVVPALSEVLGCEVKFIPESVGADAEAAINALQPGEIAVLENLRFHPEEEKNDPEFARQLASYADIFVEDDFTACHREHASIVGVAKLLPAVAGLQVEKEVTTITGALEAPKRPLVAVAGGAKVSTKIPILTRLIGSVDMLFIAGAMANTFFLAQSKQVGKSLVEPDQVDNARRIISSATGAHKQVMLPVDVVVTTDVDTAADVRTVDIGEVKEDDVMVDIGPESVLGLERILERAGTVIWNGPVGIAEQEAFAHGTEGVAKAIINSGAYSIVGGGDTADYINGAGLADKFSFVSTGGGASLELMEGKELPGVKVLLNKEGQ